MSDQLKPVSQEYHNGMEQAFRVIEIYLSGGSISLDQFNHEKNHWLGAPIEQKTKSEIEKFDIQSRAAHTRELNKQLREANEAVTELINNVDRLPGAFIAMAEKLLPVSVNNRVTI